MRRLIDAVRAVAFDLDGTLIDTAPDLASAANMTLTILGGRTLSEERLRGLIGSGADQFVEKALTESLGGVPPRAELLSSATLLFGNLYGQRLFEHSRLYPGVAEALQELRSAGVALCCVTNKESMFALPLLKAAQLSAYLECVLCADRAEDRKPSPNLLLAACARLRIAPAELLYVGDSRVDIAAARAAGCRVAAVEYGYDHGLAFETVRPDWFVGSLTELVMLRVPPASACLRAGTVLLQGS